MYKWVMLGVWLLMGFIILNLFYDINYSRLFKKSPPMFSIKLEHWYKDRWRISFTNDYWFKKQYLLEVQDWTVIDAGVTSTERTLDKEEAEIFATKFKTYEECLEFNLKVEKEVKKLQQYYEENPPPKKLKEIEEPKPKDIIIK